MEDESYAGCAGQFFIYAVYDGHGGSDTARKIKNELGARILQDLDQIRKQDEAQVVAALYKSFRDQEEALFEEWTMSETPDMSGSCAIVLVRNGEHLYVCNLGDSRCIVASKTTSDVLFETTDHKPNGKSEKQRILSAQGWVADQRVNGILATSRAFGDFSFFVDVTDSIQQVKKLKSKPEQQLVAQFGLKLDSNLRLLDNPPVSAVPEIQHLIVSKPKSYAVLCCDGVFEVMSSSSVVSFINMTWKTNESTSSEKICQLLAEHAYNLGSEDNLSVVIVRLNF